MLDATFLNRNNQTKWFLLSLAACLGGLPREESITRMNFVLHCCCKVRLVAETDFERNAAAGLC